MTAEPAPLPPEGITFRVEGMNPAPQGSKTVKGRRKNGSVILVESCQNVKPWRELVKDTAIACRVPMIRGPVSMTAVFIFRRPPSHFGAKGLSSVAPRWHMTRPDGSKLLRSTEDALTKVLYEDDGRIVFSAWEKRFCVDDSEQPGAIITIIPLPH